MQVGTAIVTASVITNASSGGPAHQHRVVVEDEWPREPDAASGRHQGPCCRQEFLEGGRLVDVLR